MIWIGKKSWLESHGLYLTVALQNDCRESKARNGLTGRQTGKDGIREIRYKVTVKAKLKQYLTDGEVMGLKTRAACTNE